MSEEYEALLQEMGCELREVTVFRVVGPRGLVLAEGDNREQVIRSSQSVLLSIRAQVKSIHEIRAHLSKEQS